MAKWTTEVFPEPPSATGATVCLTDVESGARFDLHVEFVFEPMRLVTNEDRERMRRLTQEIATRMTTTEQRT